MVWKDVLMLSALASVLVSTALSAQVHVVSEPYLWKPVSVVGGGFITGIVAHPTEKNLFYARTDVGGAYRWDAGAQRWIPLLDFIGPRDEFLLGVETMALDPTDPNRLYLATGEYSAYSGSGNHRKGAIFRSADRGASFERVDLPIELGANELGRAAGPRMAVDPAHPADIYFGTPVDGLWLSRDHGASWAQMKSFPVRGRTGGGGTGVVGVVFDARPQHPASIFVATSDPGTGLYRSDDAGAHWTAVEGQPSGLLANTLAQSGESLYLTYGDKPGPRGGMADGAVWRYDIDSSHWTNITPDRASSANPHGYFSLCVDPGNAGTVMVSSMGAHYTDDILRSADAGAHWHSISQLSTRDTTLAPYLPHVSATKTVGFYLGALLIDPFDANHFLYGTGFMLYDSHDITNADHDKPVHFAVDAVGIEELVVTGLVSPPQGPPLVSAVMDVGGFRHDNLDHTPSSNFENPVFGTQGTDSLDYAQKQPNIMIRSGSTSWSNHVAYSDDGGASWSQVDTEPKPAGKPLMDGGSVAISSDGRTALWSPEADGMAIYRSPVNPASDKFHAHWEPAGFAGGTPTRAYVLSDRVDPNTFYAYDRYSGTLYVSRDAGANFSTMSEHATHALPQPSPAAAGDLWMAEGGGLRHSTDFGKSFSSIPFVQQALAIGFGKAGPGATQPTLYLSGRVSGIYGIFRSYDGGNTWVRINDDAHQYSTVRVITGDPRISGRVYLGTPGRGILYGSPQ